MPSTAWTTPSSVRNSTARSVIESSGSGTNSALLRVEGIAKAVADEVDAEDDEHDREAREHRQPPLLRVVLAAGDERAERRRGRLDPEPEEGERSLDEDRRRDGERAGDDDGAERVRQDVPEHDPEVARTGCLCRLDVLLLSQRQEDAAHDTRDRRPVEAREDERDAPLAALAEKRRNRQQDREERERQHE